jgi:GNAT superfamily N-acetyltransferase
LAPSDLAELLAEGEAEGHRFLRRLNTKLVSGSNRFQRPGEALFVARDDDRIVAVCGLNVDPYAGEHVGRVRHLYVRAAYRQRGVGRMLVGAVVAHGRQSFTRLHLCTHDAWAARFYEAVGFRPEAGNPHFSHAL